MILTLLATVALLAWWALALLGLVWVFIEGLHRASHSAVFHPGNHRSDR